MRSPTVMAALEIAIGATASTLSIFWIVLMSSRVRLDLTYWLLRVSSSMILSATDLEVVGRTRMRLAYSLLLLVLMRLLMPPVRERIKTIDATPMAMPRAERKVRPRLRRRLSMAR